MALVPLGIVGELHTGEAVLATGYLYDVHLTSTKFIAGPFDERPGARLHRTGDVVKRLPDGNVQFLGRAERQNKIRGFRVEPGEIEARLLDPSDVDQAVVMVREDHPRDRRLAAYIAPHSSARIDIGEVRPSVAKRLPPHMVPSRFLVPDEPLVTSTRKIDRRDLPASEASETGDEQTVVAPRTSSKREMAEEFSI